jgi:hypothetical protein
MGENGENLNGAREIDVLWCYLRVMMATIMLLSVTMYMYMKSWMSLLTNMVWNKLSSTAY